jgi:ADP-ribose pyrophosphatase YjhB (NUDIX family)
MTDVDQSTPPMARPRVAAGALFTDDEGRVLMVRPTSKDYWDIPGGYVEPGESPRAACRRELEEELGVSPWVGRLLVADWAPQSREGDKLLFIFAGEGIAPTDIDRLILQRGEIAEVRFIAPEELAGLSITRLVRRINSAVGRLSSRGDDSYLEHGLPVERIGGAADGPRFTR